MKDLNENLPSLSTPEYLEGQCKHDIVYKAGTAYGKQRVSCKLCGKKWTPGSLSYSEKRCIVIKLLMIPGNTMAGISRKTGFSPAMIRKMAVRLGNHLPNCPCGKKQGHFGPCFFRKSL